MRALSCAVPGSEDRVGGIVGVMGIEVDLDRVLLVVVVLDVAVPDDDDDDGDDGDDDDGREEGREDGEEEEADEPDGPFPLGFPVAVAAVFLTVERGDLGDEVGGSSGLVSGMGCGFARMAS